METQMPTMSIRRSLIAAAILLSSSVAVCQEDSDLSLKLIDSIRFSGENEQSDPQDITVTLAYRGGEMARAGLGYCRFRSRRHPSRPSG